MAITDPGSILVTGPLPEPALEVADQRARDLGIQHRRFGIDYSLGEVRRGVGGWMATVHGAEADYEDVFLPIHGRYQLVNLAIALAASEALVGRALDPEAVRVAAAAATMPGRMEPLPGSPFIMVDGAHNPDGVATLVESLYEEYANRRWHLLFGVMGDKDVELMLQRLAPMIDGVVTTAVESKRAVPAAELAERALSVVEVPVVASESVEQGLDMVRAEAGPEGSVLVTGSLYLVGDVRSLLMG
ncbi:MAG TPA: hypothetical protein EYP73_00235 [Acidimicrobiia bacterium]|nr:hypothetical protein [Acidimicrobiia bacterium]